MMRWFSNRISSSRGLASIFILLACTLCACHLNEPLPAYDQNRNCYAVQVADGPEDFVLDRWGPSPRLLISSMERRAPARSGNIYFFDTITGYSNILPRSGEPETLMVFKPGGLDIHRTKGKTLLYVIVQDPHDRSAKEENGIAIYQVLHSELKFLELLEDKVHLWSPNDLSVLKGGDIYVTNDFRKKSDIYLKKKTSQIAHYHAGTNQWRVVKGDISFANGILALDDRVFVAGFRSNKLLAYPRGSDGTLGPGRVVVQLKGPDNIMPFGRKLLVAAHFNDLSLVRHMRDRHSPSPSAIFLIDPDAGASAETMMAVYVDTGRQFSAASTALVHDRTLYISQIFDSRILVCDAPDLVEAPD